MQKLWHVYENGADSSNLKISWIHENLIFITRIAPWDAMILPWALRIVNIRLDVWQKAAREHAVDYWTLDANRTQRATKFSKNGLATKRDRAIDLSCRACGAGAWALGLDSRLGTPASLPSFTPNLRLTFWNLTSSENTKMVEIPMVLLTCVFEMKSVASRKPYKTLSFINIVVLHLSITCPSSQENVIKPYVLLTLWSFIFL